MKNEAIAKHNREHLRACQMKELSILIEIDRVFKENGINYWLDGGTLLGAVRHKGFIPWDDDIDIAIKEEDLPRLEKLGNAFPDNLALQFYASNNGLNTIKVRDNNSIIIEGKEEFSKDLQSGLFVDIFPMRPYPDVSRKFCKKICKGYSNSNAILAARHQYSLRSFAEFFYFGAKKLICLVIWKVACLLRPMDKYYCNRLFENGYGISHRIDSIFPLSAIEFEGHSFQAPANPDMYLRDLYRNYMEIPPEDKRVSHAAFILEEL